ncbi:response regulator transcription factor [Paenibacillus endoradicis]|uniref:response regulator transcription factor n=1 Tax=Paenibacillus endoradicis TaxID=2972487 RepID=UPI002158EC6D|nr:response regulator [Paenibacillus endoradicis]MCR8657192.1 response regulator [Paenibacillus endoradicis]
MRLRALLVDDEINILRNLQMILPWEEYNVEIVGFAKNGVQALEMVHEYNPHLIFCDIRMPIMDGIEFLQNLRTFDDETEVIMLTGYQEFEYARSVLRYGVIDYILKPIDYDALQELFVKVITKIRLSVLQNQQHNMEQDRVKDIAYEKVLLDLINGFYDASHLQEWSNRFRLEEQQFVLMVLECKQHSTNFTHIDDLCEQISIHMKVTYNYDVICYMFQVDVGFWGLILVGELEGLEEHQTTELMKFCYEKLVMFGENNDVIGTFETVIAAKQIHQTWQMISKEISFANQPCIMVREAKPMLSGNVQAVWKPTEKLVSAIKHWERDLANQCLEELIRQLKLLSEESLQQVEKLANSITVYIIKELRRYDAISLQYEKEIWSQLKETRKVKELIGLINKMVDEAFGQHQYKRPQVSIHVAAEYIESHLSSDLAAEEVANHLSISLSYFSTLFKQFYGVTFIEYVTNARIDRAKSMLTMTKKSIADIAKTVGYNERRYFNKVFQKRVGILPSEYREQKTI